MRMLVRAYGRAVVAQLQGKMLLQSAAPFVLALIVWAALLWTGFQPLVDAVQRNFVEYDAFKLSSGILTSLGLGAFKAIIVPLLAMWLLLPLMIVTALVFIGAIAMPAVVRFCAARHFPDLERKRGGSFFGSMWTALSSFALFVLLWLATLPLAALLPLTLFLHAALLAWLTARVMRYDAWAAHASTEERLLLERRHRWPLLAIGFCAGLLGAVPTMLWLGGPLAFVLFPLVAALAIFLYVLVFNFTGLWFSYYCLEALRRHRQDNAAAPTITITE